MSARRFLGSDVFRTIRKVESQKVRSRERRIQRGPNGQPLLTADSPIRRAYVDAAIDAHITNEKRLQLGIMSSTTDLELLESASGHRALLTDSQNGAVTSKSQSKGDVAFGSWRTDENPGSQLGYATALLCRSTSLVRGQLTPPELSPELWFRSLPISPQAPLARKMRVLVDSIKKESRVASLHHQRQASSARDMALRLVSHASLMHSSMLGVGCSFGDADAANDSVGESRSSKLAAWIVHEGASINWMVGLAVMTMLLPPPRGATTSVNTKPKEDAVLALSPSSTSVALESLREHGGHLGFSSAAALSTTLLSRGVLKPNGVAPLLAMMQLKECSWRKALSCCTDITKRLPHRASGGDDTDKENLSSLPCVAVAQLLLALHRSQAPLSVLQSIVDVFTDPQHCSPLSAARNLKSSYISAAYLHSCSPWEHALDVFTHNLPHHGIKATGAVYAGLMHSLTAGGRWDLSLSVFRNMKQAREPAPVVTAAVIKEMIEAYTICVKNNAQSMADRKAMSKLLRTVKQELVHFAAACGNRANKPVLDDASRWFDDDTVSIPMLLEHLSQQRLPLEVVESAYGLRALLLSFRVDHDMDEVDEDHDEIARPPVESADVGSFSPEELQRMMEG